MLTPIILKFGENQVELFPESTRITLRCGSTILGAPEDTDGYRQTAYNNGYGTDTLRLCKEHEATHVALAHWLGLNESPTMRLVATNEGKQYIADTEEAAVLAIQRFANAVGIKLI